jgi:hypothetical protein
MKNVIASNHSGQKELLPRSLLPLDNQYTWLFRCQALSLQLTISRVVRRQRGSGKAKNPLNLPLDSRQWLQLTERQHLNGDRHVPALLEQQSASVA